MRKRNRNREIREGDGPTLGSDVIREEVPMLANQLYCACRVSIDMP